MSIELDLGPMPDDALRGVLREQVLQGRVFLAGAYALAPPLPCVLRIALGELTLHLSGEVVFAHELEPGRGIGLELAPLDEDARSAIDAFLDAPIDFELTPSIEPGETAVSFDAPPIDFELTPSIGLREATDGGDPEAPTEGGADGDDAFEAHESRALHVRMRSLTGVEQRRYAATGNLGERVMLERLYGPSVWEPLIASLRLTHPEVATIARKGTVPRPLIELIASNAGWLQSGEVQRALLANPRSSPMVIAKVLRLLPKHDLARVPIQTAYPATVRQAAKEMLNRGR